jgi:4-amino-4-deoxy-L-arabinose transferase-like glycosyltransferase
MSDSVNAPQHDEHLRGGTGAKAGAESESASVKRSARLQRREVEEARFKFALLMALVLLALAPFLNKAVHMDDPLFIYSAQQILQKPADFYGFNVNWYGFEQAMHDVNQNPPLAAYYLALVGYVAGFDEWALHAGFLLPAIGVALGTYSLAWHLCARPTLAAALTFVLPVTLLSSTTLMCDTLLLCCWCWAVACWLDAERRHKPWKFVIAGLCIAAAALTKYYGICLVPLLAGYGIACRTPLGRRPGTMPSRDRGFTLAQIVGLLIPCLALAGFEVWTQQLYGHGLVSDSLRYAGAARETVPIAWYRQLVFGACTLPVLLLVAHAWGLGGIASTILAFGALAGIIAWHGSYLGYAPPSELSWHWMMPLEAAAFLLSGGFVALLGVMDFYRRRDAESLLLALWVVGTFVFATYMNWTLTSRTFLPLAPAVAIWGLRALDRRQAMMKRAANRLGLAVIVLLGLVLSLAVAAADASWANSARQAASMIPEFLFTRDGIDSARLWFQGHWGFQYYMEQQGSRPIDFTRSKLLPDEFVVIPNLQSNTTFLPPAAADTEQPLGFHVLQGVSTISPVAGAQFYMSQIGLPFPYAFGPNVPEVYYVVHVRAELEFEAKQPSNRPERRPPEKAASEAGVGPSGGAQPLDDVAP